jgi:hypothetical protein
MRYQRHPGWPNPQLPRPPPACGKGSRPGVKRFLRVWPLTIPAWTPTPGRPPGGRPETEARVAGSRVARPQAGAEAVAGVRARAETASKAAPGGGPLRGRWSGDTSASRVIRPVGPGRRISNGPSAPGTLPRTPSGVPQPSRCRNTRIAPLCRHPGALRSRAPPGRSPGEHQAPPGPPMTRRTDPSRVIRPRERLRRAPPGWSGRGGGCRAGERRGRYGRRWGCGAGPRRRTPPG